MPVAGKYLDAMSEETRAFVARTEQFSPDGNPPFTLDQQRASYNELCKAFHAGYPSGISAEDHEIGSSHSLKVRVYRKTGSDPAVTLVYLHGGGFVLGGLESHDDICAELCDQTGFCVVSVDYRLSPEHPFPADLEDALAGCRWALATIGHPIIVCGDSAGACLAAAVCHQTRGTDQMPVGQVLIYPTLGGDMSKGSYVEHADAPVLTLEGMEFYHRCRLGGGDWLTDPRFSPLRDQDFSGLPPTIAISADLDPLRDDSAQYCERIMSAGGQAQWINETGLVHGYLRARHCDDTARASFGRIVLAIRELGSGNWTYHGAKTG